MTRLASRSGALFALLLAGCAVDATTDGSGAESASDPLVIGLPPPPPTFTVKALGRMCVDFGGEAYWSVGLPVTLYWCNGTAAQKLTVTEVGPSHDVNLRVGSQYCIGARGGPVAGAELELETCDGSEGQQFALDGDSIIAGHRPWIVNKLAASTIVRPPVYTPAIARELVVKPLGDATAAKTRLVLGPRELSENEYLRFVANDGSDRPPHSGFVRPADGPSLVGALAGASWGTVVELRDGTYDLTWQPNNAIPAGVTLRGYRKLTDNGPQIRYGDNAASVAVFTIAADDVRVTGLRLEGPSRSTSADRVTTGIRITDGHRVTIDHVEGSNFTTAAVAVDGPNDAAETQCPLSPPPYPRSTPVRVARSFFHHNEADSAGYGIVTGHGAFPLFEGNVFYMNRHAIAADYRGETGYVARDNLALSSVPSYGGWEGLFQYKNQDFDLHGSKDPPHYKGGFAGDYVQMFFNTFLGDDHPNIEIRGVPCRTSTLDSNVFTKSDGTRLYDASGDEVDSIPNLVEGAGNRPGSPNPTNELGVGDFDGDGADDLFLATGAAWFYASGGKAEWRLLRRAPEHVKDVRIGDLDGDGRADVIAVHSLGTIDVSWGGVSSWRLLSRTPAPAPIANFTIGNFDGDRLHGDDVFMTTGAAWFVAPSGRAWAPAQTSSFPMSSLRFGDFDHDGKTDVLGVNGGKWSISSAAQGSWTPLGGISTSSFDGMFVADLDGDGTADVVRDDLGGLVYSRSGRDPWKAVVRGGFPVVAHGRFQGGARDALLWWSGNGLELGAGVTAPVAPWSRQDMR